MNARRCGRTLGTAVVVAVWLALSGGCGGAAKEAQAPASPSTQDAPKSYGEPAGTMQAPGPTSTYPAPYPPPAPQPTSGGGAFPPGPSGVDAARAQARADIDRAQRELEASASDCAAACRALASLERATSRLCSLAEQPDDRQRCEDAKEKLRSARDRVRQTCSACPGGPSVERGAPLPPP